MVRGTRSSNPIYFDFADRLAREARARRCGLSVWRAELKRRGRRSTRNILQLTGVVDLLLYVKIRSSPPGFWGLAKSRIADLESSACPWAMALLVGSTGAGYLVPSEEVARRIQSGDWRLASDGDYRVSEGRTLDVSLRFGSFTELAQSVFSEHMGKHGASSASRVARPLGEQMRL